MPPAVSVLIPAYNRLDYLPQTLASVYAQSFQDFETIVIDDGSTDGTGAWLKSRRFPRLTCRRSRRNLGPAAARNLALDLARGRLLAFLDSDDVWAPGFLRGTMAALEGAETLVACCELSTIDAEGKLILTDFYRTNPKNREPRFERLSGLLCCPVLSACLLRREALQAVGRFDEGFRRIHDDKDLLYRIARRFGRPAFRFVPDNLVFHRRHAEQITSYIESGRGYLASRRALGRWDRLPPKERELILDVVYFSSKHDCRHCDGLHEPGRPHRTRRRARATSR